MYVNQCNIVNNLIQTSKEVYFNDELESADSKNMFSVLNRLLNKNVKSLPTCDSVSELSNSFAHFFINKVAKIRQELSDINSTQCNDVETIVISNARHMIGPIEQFDAFKHVSTEDIEKVVLASSTKSCMLDPLPMWLFKENISVMCNALKEIVNTSFSTGEFPSKLREAVVSPVLKKSNLDKNILQNYRPVSNIRYYSKIIEKIASIQLQDHLIRNGLQEEFQSAYRAQHSTETALLRVKTDIAGEMDRGNAVFVVLLDLSAAFDTVDHHILLDRLYTTFNISGTALSWIRSYLHDRIFRVSVGGGSSVSGVAGKPDVTSETASNTFKLKFGVPQGSVLGPLFFVLYTYCIGAIIRKHGICFHIYADDIQLYIAFDPKIAGAAELALTKLSACIKDIYEWMTRNMLKLNQSKTEFFVAASSYYLKTLQDVSLTIGDSSITPSSTIKNLGVVFDQTLSMSDHVRSVVKTVNFHLRNIYRIRRYITFDSCNHLVRSLILSRLDYANSLLYGISEMDRVKLQRLQNRAARLIYKCNRLHPSEPLRRELHWLPVDKRVIFKILLLTFKGMQDLTPAYLSQLHAHYKPGRNLRSSNANLLHVPRTYRSVGDHSFHVAGPCLWNSLPLYIRHSPSVNVFKKLLKTYLFPPE